MPLLGRYQPPGLRWEETEPWKDGRVTGTLPHTRGVKKTTGPETQSKAGRGTKAQLLQVSSCCRS